MLNKVRKNQLERRLECVWIPTGNPRQPLACVWMENAAVLLQNIRESRSENEIEETRR